MKSPQRQPEPAPKGPTGEPLGRTLAKLLEQLGMQRRGYVDKANPQDRPFRHKRGMSLWGREEHTLQQLAAEIKHVFHQKLKLVKHDDAENHERSVWLIAIYTRLKKLFKGHGIDM